LEGFIKETVGVYVEKIRGKKTGRVEWNSEFSVPVAVTVISKILGFPVEGYYES